MCIGAAAAIIGFAIYSGLGRTHSVRYTTAFLPCKPLPLTDGHRECLRPTTHRHS
jgi:hypothetical protein